MPRDTSHDHLHGELTRRLRQIDAALADAGLASLRLYEGARSPFRQVELYSRGRGVGPPGKFVTKARAWESFHQFGCAVDYVFWSLDRGWSWDEPTPGAWARWTEIAQRYGLRTLSFERPHAELPLSLGDLQRGKYPPGGGDAWEAWLEREAEAWGQEARTIGGQLHPAAPPVTIDRPPLA